MKTNIKYILLGAVFTCLMLVLFFLTVVWYMVVQARTEIKGLDPHMGEIYGREQVI